MDYERRYKELLREHLVVIEDGIEAWQSLLSFRKEWLARADDVERPLLEACLASGQEVLLDLELRKLTVRDVISKELGDS